jgi:hypothetical protein
MYRSPAGREEEAILPALHFIHDDNEDDIQVLPTDKIMIKDLEKDWDNSPIVIAKYKLLFFTIPKVSCTLWKQLFRRIQGLDDWKSQNYTLYLPHNPEHNGLTYLNEFNTSYAKQIFQDPTWTKAIFVRDPKERFLSAFLDKVVSNYGVHIRDKCCAKKGERNLCFENESCRQCVKDALTIPGFLKKMETCHDAHWDAISNRMEPKYWKYINFVGKMKTLARDGQRLLEKLGAWEPFASTGWGPDSNSSMFDRKTMKDQSHTTDSKSKVWQYYTPAMERLVEEHYEEDYRLFQFPKTALTIDIDKSFVHPSDSVWNHEDWDQSPIVVEKYKLIFFTAPRVGASVWKKAFRRMEGYEDWQSDASGLPHDPSRNGLKYLYSYEIEKASDMMTSKQWTRVVFVRNPKDRLMSVYNQYKRDPGQLKHLCCPLGGGCEHAAQSLTRFLSLIQDCRASHWNPQSDRMEEKYWNQIDFIGHIENAAYDAKKLLKRIGAWDEIGSSGWGIDGQSRIFASTGREYDTVLSVMADYNPILDKLVEAYYEKDYENERFEFSRIPNVLLHATK